LPFERSNIEILYQENVETEAVKELITNKIYDEI
jgi:hypothetical protein